MTEEFTGRVVGDRLVLTSDAGETIDATIIGGPSDIESLREAVADRAKYDWGQKRWDVLRRGNEYFVPLGQKRPPEDMSSIPVFDARTGKVVRNPGIIKDVHSYVQRVEFRDWLDV